MTSSQFLDSIVFVVSLIVLFTGREVGPRLQRVVWLAVGAAGLLWSLSLLGVVNL